MSHCLVLTAVSSISGVGLHRSSSLALFDGDGPASAVLSRFRFFFLPPSSR